MRRADWLRLLLLGAIWGASFIFLRVLAPRLGTVTTAELRVGVGGLAFLPYFAVKHFYPRVRAHWKHYVVAGLFNIAAPVPGLPAFSANFRDGSLLGGGPR